MARIVHTLVSVSGHLAVRYSFGISGVLRSRGLPGVFVFPTLLWPVCARRPAMRRCIDVDLRYRRLLNRRDGLHRALTLAPSIAPTIGRTRDFAIRLATHCGSTHGSAQDGGGLMSQSAVTERSPTAVQERHLGGSTLLSDYWALTKPEVSFLILITTLWGFI